MCRKPGNGSPKSACISGLPEAEIAAEVLKKLRADAERALGEPVKRAGITDLAEGQRVAVNIVDGSKGPEAADVRLIA